MGDLWTFWKTWWPSIVIFVLASVMTGVLVYLGCEDITVYHAGPRDEILRNYGLLIAALWAAFLAVWRSQIAGRQAESALKQVEISERGLRSERFQKGADMLGNKTFAIRMGGIHALEFQARDHPEDYLNQIIKLLAAFVRYPGSDEEIEKLDPKQIKTPDFREDVWEAVRIISDLNNKAVEHDKPSLDRSNLDRISFMSKDFSRMTFIQTELKKARFVDCDFTGTNFAEANFTEANLTCVDITGARLTHARCYRTNFTGTNFTDTDISGVDFFEATEFSQEQLDKACHYPSEPPKNLPSGLVLNEEACIERWERAAERAGWGPH